MPRKRPHPRPRSAKEPIDNVAALRGDVVRLSRRLDAERAASCRHLFTAIAGHPAALAAALKAASTERKERTAAERRAGIRLRLGPNRLTAAGDHPDAVRLAAGARLRSDASQVTLRAVAEVWLSDEWVRQVASDVRDDGEIVAPQKPRARELGAAVKVLSLEQAGRARKELIHDAWARESFLWHALNLEPPRPPTRREVKALDTRASELRKRADDFAAAAVLIVEQLPGLTAEVEYHGAQLRLAAGTSKEDASYARERLNEGPDAAVNHRRARVLQLAAGLRVGEDEGWSLIDLARLVLASSRDWTVAPCPVLAARYELEDEKLRDVLGRDLGRPGRRIPRVREVAR